MSTVTELVVEVRYDIEFGSEKSKQSAKLNLQSDRLSSAGGLQYSSCAPR